MSLHTEDQEREKVLALVNAIRNLRNEIRKAHREFGFEVSTNYIMFQLDSLEALATEVERLDLVSEVPSFLTD